MSDPNRECRKCRTTYSNPERAAACECESRRHWKERWFNRIMVLVIAIIVYDDWTCAFAHCVKVK